MILRLLFVVRRRWPILVAIPVIAAVAAVLIGPSSSSHQAPVYASTAIISADMAGANQTEVEQALVKATKGKMAEAIAERVGGGATAADVASHISTDFELKTFVTTVVARSTSPKEAAAYAKAFSEVFIADANDGAGASGRDAIEAATKDRAEAKAELDAFVAQHEAELSSGTPSPVLTSEQSTLEAAYSEAASKLSNLESTMTPTNIYDLVSVSPPREQAPSKLQVFANPTFRLMLGLQLGLLAACLVVFIAERMNPRIDEPSQVEAIVGAPVLAMVPVLGRRRRGLITRVDPAEFRGPFAEAFRTMRAHLDFRANAAGLEQAPRIMVTSATPSEGKSTTAAFLALSYAESNRSPVVIGGDFRRPTIHRLFGVERIPGLTSRSLPGGKSTPLTSIVRHDAVSGVTLVPSGPSVDQVNDVMSDLTAVSEVAQSSGQVVILDTAPVRVANDAIDFLSAVDWVVLVVKAGKSTQRSVAQMMHSLRMNGAEIVGVVMVGSVEASDASRDYYSYYAPEVRSRRDRRKARAEQPASPVAAAS